VVQIALTKGQQVYAAILDAPVESDPRRHNCDINTAWGDTSGNIQLRDAELRVRSSHR
jgi:hypothetical protein